MLQWLRNNEFLWLISYRILVADQDFKVQYFVLMVNQACHFFTLARNKNLAPHFSDISLLPGFQIDILLQYIKVYHENMKTQKGMHKVCCLYKRKLTCETARTSFCSSVPLGSFLTDGKTFLLKARLFGTYSRRITLDNNKSKYHEFCMFWPQ